MWNTCSHQLLDRSLDRSLLRVTNFSPSFPPFLLQGGQILKRLTTKFILSKEAKAVKGGREGGSEEGLELYMFEGGETEEIKAALRTAVDAVEGEGGQLDTEVRAIRYIMW